MSYAKIHIQANQKNDEIFEIVKSAIDDKIIKLELAKQLFDSRLLPFEKKYNITSDYFMTNMAAEDLDGGDDEYVTWAGEYKLKKKLDDKLNILKGIQYVN
jgi:hypothetical protein